MVDHSGRYNMDNRTYCTIQGHFIRGIKMTVSELITYVRKNNLYDLYQNIANRLFYDGVPYTAETVLILTFLENEKTGDVKNEAIYN